MLAIQAAVRGLQASYGDVGTAERETLRDGIESEIGILRRLVDPDSQSAESRRPFDVRAVITPVVAFQRLNGLAVDFEVPAGLTAVGRPSEVAQVVQTLLDNARNHAQGAHVVVDGFRWGNSVFVRVEDDGPGVACADRERIFRRGVGDRSGSGLGLYVARRLMRDQGGDVAVDDRPGRGATFVVALTAPSLRCRPGTPAHRPHDADHVIGGIDVDAFSAARGDE
jgi:signal transduction histidine kinase